MTPEQEDSILQALRPLCPNQSPEELRGILRYTLEMMPKGQDAVELEEQLLKEFPDLINIFKASP